MIKAAAIIVAAGKSRRFNKDNGELKQFTLLGGKPVYLWSVEAFSAIKEIKKILLVLPRKKVKEISARHSANRKIICIAGGKERFESVVNALKKLPPDINIVAIHDAARPLIKKSIIKKSLTAAQKYGAAIVATNATDTIKTTQDGEFIARTIPRHTVRIAQTPQVFRREIILESYETFMKNASTKSGKPIASPTDDSSLAEEMGIKVKIIEGDISNFKITTREDLLKAETLTREQQ